MSEENTQKDQYSVHLQRTIRKNKYGCRNETLPHRIRSSSFEHIRISIHDESIVCLFIISKPPEI